MFNVDYQLLVLAKEHQRELREQAEYDRLRRESRRAKAGRTRVLDRMRRDTAAGPKRLTLTPYCSNHD